MAEHTGIVQIQAITQIIESGSLDWVIDNGITEKYFDGYREEFKYILDHYNQYGNVPDRLTFQDKFREFEETLYGNMNEAESYLIDKLTEEAMFRELCPVTQKFNEMATSGKSHESLDYIIPEFDRIREEYSRRDKTVSINRTAFNRYEDYYNQTQSSEPYMYGTGFEELDSLIGGLRKSEELAVIYARTGNCKTWILNKMLQYNFHLGRTVGVFSPEMSATTYGKRFDTLEGHFDNHLITSGRMIPNVDDYKEYALAMSSKSGAEYFYCNPATFNNHTTVSELRKWVKKHNIQILGIDGISYMTDERYCKGDSRTMQLTHISEDLMQMSIEMQIPIIVVAQANRTGVSENTPELDSIRDSDGISHNATLAISSKMTDTILTLKITKNRYGKVGDKVKYRFNVNNGVFEANPLDASEEFDDLGVRDRGVKNKQPLERQGSTLHPF